jgi:hypothetical protein
MSDFLDELTAELTRAGVRGRTRGRIVAEFADHLECDPAAELGSPSELASEFADELGTHRARRGAAAVFVALATAGLLFAAIFVAFPGIVGLSAARSPVLGAAAVVLFLVAPQFAFVTGLLAAVRAFWRRGERRLCASEAAVIVRRSAIALGTGLLTMAAIALLLIVYPHAGGSGGRTFAAIAAATGTVALIAVLPLVAAASRLRPAGQGTAGDFTDDLGPFIPAAWRGHPWRPAVVVAAFVGLAVAFAGLVVSDPYDGLLRGLLEAGACLGGFAVFGRYLGLRPAAA